MSEQQWTILAIGAVTIIGVCIGRVLERVAMAREKQEEFEARRWVDERHLQLHRDDITPPAA